MSLTNNNRALLCALSLLLPAVLFVAHAEQQAKEQTSASAQPSVVKAAEMQWRDGPPTLPAGAQMVVLDGDPRKQGSFTMRLKMPAGYKIPPHTHPTAERVTVISGTVHLGIGARFDESGARELQPGDFAVLPPGVPHFAWSAGEAVLQIHSEGPFERQFVERGELDDRGAPFAILSTRSADNTEEPEQPGFLARFALAMTDWTERWVPDAFIFALIATIIVVVAGVAFTPSTVPQVIDAWGRGFWELIPFTLQMALIIITGHVLATSAPVGRVIRGIAAWPTKPRNAVALVAFFAMASSWFNWGFSLIFSAVLAKEVARRVEGVDYRALAAASFLGLGSIWAQGLSGSAALQMASPGALQPQIRDIVAAGGLVPGGIIPFRDTIFLWQSFVSVIVEIAVVTAVMWLVTPPAGRGKTASDLGIVLGNSEMEPATTVEKPTPGQWLEHSPILNWLIVLIGGTYLVRYFMLAAEPLNAINLNIVNLMFLLLGFLLHKTPARLMHAVQTATPAVWGVILQFPFYAGIAGIITSTALSQQIAHAFVGISSRETFPAVVAIYSAVLGVFVPSGGSKWVIEAPYVMAAAHELKVHLGWVVAAYDLGEALANLVQPFWMLPILGLFQLRARDVMGYTFVVFLVLVPVVLLLVTILGATLSYPL